MKTPEQLKGAIRSMAAKKNLRAQEVLQMFLFERSFSMNDTFMKEKPVFPLILSMALPMVISMLVNSLYNIVDSFFVAQISENAMTALTPLPGSATA